MMIAGRIIIKASSAFLMVLMLTCCSGQKQDKAGVRPAAQPVVKAEQASAKDTSRVKHKVTFIELGSVRCIPCQQMQPVMDTIKARYGKQVNVVFHDVWTQQGAPFADKFGVSAIPTQVFLDENGKEYFRHVGFFPLEELVSVLEQQGVRL